jgi:predicted enzyme involved in methoxymalonyl-ACP biosynthesis
VDKHEHTPTTASRTELYKRHFERLEWQQVSNLSYADFLRSLEVRIEVRVMSAGDLDRVAELSQRTNQFNSTTIRKSKEEIGAFAHSILHGHRQDPTSWSCVLCGEVSDRFGPYGLTIAAFCKGGIRVRQSPAESTYHVEVDSLLMSCRDSGEGWSITWPSRLRHVVSNRQCDAV